MTGQDGSRTYSRTVVHHKGWARVEEVRDGIIHIGYGNFHANAWLSATKADGDDFSSVMVKRAVPSRDHEGIGSAREGADAGSYAGEHCKWWQLFRRGPGNGQYGPFWFSCQSADGIEIATKTLLSADDRPMSETQLVKLTRGPVAEAEVRPPARLFRPDFWLAPLRAYPEKPATAADFEVRMVSGNAAFRMLRHYPWRAEEQRDEDGTVRFRVWNELDDQGIFVVFSGESHWFRASRSLRKPGRFSNSFDIATGQIDLERSDEYLGEPCRWFDMTPNMADAGKEQCLTADGIPLREYRMSWVGRADLTVVSLVRRPVELEELFPPAELMAPSNLGFTPLHE